MGNFGNAVVIVFSILYLDYLGVSRTLLMVLGFLGFLLAFLTWTFPVFSDERKKVLQMQAELLFEKARYYRWKANIMSEPGPKGKKK